MRFFILIYSIFFTLSLHAEFYTYELKALTNEDRRYGQEPYLSTAMGDMFRDDEAQDGRYTFAVSLFNFKRLKNGMIVSFDKKLQFATVTAESCPILKNASQLKYADSVNFSDNDFKYYKGFLIIHNIESDHYGLMELYDHGQMLAYVQSVKGSDDLSKKCGPYKEIQSFWGKYFVNEDIKNIKLYDSPWMKLRSALLEKNHEAALEALEQANSLENISFLTWAPSSIFDGKFGAECTLNTWDDDDKVRVSLLFLAVAQNDVPIVKRMVQLGSKNSSRLTIGQGALRGSCSGHWVKESYGWMSLSIIDYAKLQGYKEIVEILEGHN